MLRWPYEDGLITALIHAISESEPFPRYTRNQGAMITEGVGETAEGFLMCGEHVLDVNYDDWYWDGIRLETPRQISNLEILQQGAGSTYLKTNGNQSPIIQGNHNKVRVSSDAFSFLSNPKFSLSISFALTVSLIFNLIQNNQLQGRKGK